MPPLLALWQNLGSSALNPANQLISGGRVQLNKTDEYLSDLPNSAQAELLWFPKSGGEIFRDGPGDLANWLTEINNIRSINENHEFHAHGEVIKGMQVFDHYEAGHSTKYGEARADTIKQAWEQAKQSGQAVMTGAALVTPELIRGYRVGGSSDNKSVSNNLRDDAGKLNVLIAQQNLANGLSEETGQIITQRDSGNSRWQFTSRENRVKPSHVYSIDLTGGCLNWGPNRVNHSSSLAGVLRVFAI